MGWQRVGYDWLTKQQPLFYPMWLINHWNEYEYSVLNVAGEELVSRVRMADEINRRFKNNFFI